MFNVNANLFRACALFQITEATRYYLAGVHIESCPMGGAILVATDGHRALVAHDPDGSTDGEYIVSLDKAALAACKADRHEISDRRVTSTDAKSPAWVTDAAGEQLHMVKKWLVGGQFPDWRRVLPRSDATAGFTAYDSALLASFNTAAHILSDNKTTAISLAGSATNGPALVKFASTDAVFGVLMPVRWNTDPTSMPDWMNTKA
jgi:DNA polymerase III sliding clamp (beta) subunit (PCNA family)